MAGPEPIMVTLRHARAASLGGGVLCASGVREWCARYGIDLHQLAGDGIPVEEVEAVDDAYAQRAAAIAREEAARG